MHDENPISNFCESVSDYIQGVKNNIKSSKIGTLSRIIQLREEIKEKENLLKKKNMNYFEDYETVRNRFFNDNDFEKSSRGYFACVAEELRLNNLLGFLEQYLSENGDEKPITKGRCFHYK